MRMTKHDVLVAPMDAAEASRKVQYVSRGSDIHRALLGLIGAYGAGKNEVQITLDLVMTVHAKALRRARILGMAIGAGCIILGFLLGVYT